MEAENLNRVRNAEKLADELEKQALLDRERLLTEARVEAEEILRTAEQRVIAYGRKQKAKLEERAEIELAALRNGSNEKRGKLRRVSGARVEEAARAVFRELRGHRM